MSRNKKRPKREFEPSQEKAPRHKEVATGYLTLRPSWQISRIDEQGRWGWNNIGAEEFENEVISKVKNLESNTWGQILGPKNHEVLISEICRDAQKRLVQLNLEDIESLVTLRLTGRKRIWGIRDGSVLKILWWDPEHEVCPSNLKHT